MLNYTQAQQQLLSFATLTAVTQCPLIEALGRFLAEDIYAPVSLPPFNNSAMDGYALHLPQGQGAKQGQVFPVSARIIAGDAAGSLGQGEAARIFTGAALPSGANTVVMQESVVRDAITGEITLQQAVQYGANVRYAGEDIRQDSLVLSTGTQLNAQQIAVLAALGFATVAVHQALSIALISTGNELRELGETLAAGQIYDCNRYLLRSLLEKLGFTVHDYGIAPDNLAQTQSMLAAAAAAHPIVISSGGVSVGEEDYVKAALQNIGSIDFWKVAIKPGKPLAVGTIGESRFFGLPGNPVSCWVTFMLMVQPYLLRCVGASQPLPSSLLAQADFSRTKTDAKRVEFVRATLRLHAEGAFVQPLQAQGSAMLSGLLAADGLVEIPAASVIQQGDKLRYYPFTL